MDLIEEVEMKIRKGRKEARERDKGGNNEGVRNNGRWDASRIHEFPNKVWK